MSPYVVVLSSVCISALAQTCLKYGVSTVRVGEGLGAVAKIFSFLQSPFVILGFALYGVGAMLWLLALQKLHVSLAYPFVSVAIILVVLSGIFVLGEDLTLAKGVGLTLIVGGLLVLAQG